MRLVFKYMCLCGALCKDYQEAMVHFENVHFDVQFEDGIGGDGYEIDDTKCIECQEVDGSFIPVCDTHENTRDQTEIMNCMECRKCDKCVPRSYWAQK